MTRFAADSPSDRRSLFAEAITAHRERGSQFVTVEVGETDRNSSDPLPWIQYAAEDGLLNLDCTADEIDAIEAAVEAFGGATIADRTAPDDVDGINCKVSVEGDDERVAMLIETLFRDGFGLGESYRAWVTAL